MDKQVLDNAIAEGPIRITMNNGEIFDILDPKTVLVDATTAYVLRRAEDGKLRAVWLALVCMCKIERLLSKPLEAP
ncbi:hypothetical protein SH449x_005259 [Pirellulaceae bacterium SH449]